eukprot:gene4174-biopygen1536
MNASLFLAMTDDRLEGGTGGTHYLLDWTTLRTTTCSGLNLQRTKSWPSSSRISSTVGVLKGSVSVEENPYLALNGQLWILKRVSSKPTRKKCEQLSNGTLCEQTPQFTQEFATWKIKLASWWDAKAATAAPQLGIEYHFDNTRSKKVLGVHYNDFQSSLYDTAQGLISGGFLKLKEKKSKL